MATGPPGSMSVPSDQPQPSSSDPSWEGDRMFNIYIYDYCYKRGFRKTARELLAEAEIPPDSAPPINAKQGLLFEWWSVFWVLFTAKSNGAGTDDAMIYTQGSRPLSHQIPQVNRMINGNPGPIHFQMVGGPQTNGIPMQSSASTPAGTNPAPPQNYNSLMAGQRPGPGPSQHRVANGVNPYQSPTMAHSPQNQQSNAGPNPQNPSSVMNQLGPSPHMTHMVRGGMLPPNANMGSMSSTQTPPFSQLGRSPSRPGTPNQQGMMQPSPSLMNRQTPVNPQESSLNSELSRLPTATLTTIKQELGFEKDLHMLTFDEKSRVVSLARQRSANQSVRKPGPGGLPGPAGPSNLPPNMQLAGQRMQGQPQPQQMPPQQQVPQQQPPQPQRVVKRNSTSPGEEHGQLPNNESSPPDRKRPRRSSMSEQAQQPVSGYPHQPQQAQQQMMNGGMMRPGPMPGPGPMGNFPHGPSGMATPGMGIPVGAQMPGNAMSPGMGGPRAANMQLQYHQGVHAITKGLAMANLPGGGAGTPTPGEQSFNPGPGQPPFPGPQNNRMGQNKPMGMMPPPSPAGGPSKEQQSKDGNKPPGPNGTEGSPRNQAPPNPGSVSQGGPVSANQSTQVNTAPPTPSATNSSMTAASPSTVVNGTPTMNAAVTQSGVGGGGGGNGGGAGTGTTALPEIPASFLTAEFMQNVGNALEEFDPQALFRAEDTVVNFEDFREWFNPDDLEMK